ncbi:MAG: DUF262 domain-containing protein [Cyanobacteria bacterium MAG IRC4_bin_6]|nr:DUF262 domain-containing protein [Cyanobacteria bacterium MAG IRC4_bin_6]
MLWRVKNGILTVPQFQRDFTWEGRDIRLLVDSMSRSYPIGSLLLLAKGPALPLADNSVDAEIPQNQISKRSHSDEKYYILDGQQRITSIIRVFLNADKKSYYSFDLEEMLDSKAYDKHQDSWIEITSRKHTIKIRNQETQGQYLNPDIVLDQKESHREVSKYIRNRKDLDEDKKIDAEGKILGILEAIRKYTVPVVIINQDSGLESICRIFEAVNSTGRRLKTFDLAVARFYSEIVDSERIDLKKWWRATREKYKVLKYFEVDGERILQVVCLVTAIREQQNKYSEPTRGNLLSLEPDWIKRDWENSSEALAKAYQWAQAQGAQPKRDGAKSTLPSHSVLLALAAVKSLGENPWKNDNFIRRWYFSKVIQTGVSRSLNYQISEGFQALWTYVKNDKRPEFPQVRLSVKILLKLNPTDIRYKALQNVLATTIRQDLKSGEIIHPGSILHDHHIFPRSTGKKNKINGRTLDSICNRITILANSNQGLSNKSPQIYFKNMVDHARAEGTLLDLKRRMECCLIPGNPEDPQWPDSFSIDRFDEFCRKRAELIISRVREIIGDSLQVNVSSDDESMEDDDD